MQYTTAELHIKVSEALHTFFHEDIDLLCLKANERSITHKLAEHLQRQFKYLEVDCEYNRRRNRTKKVYVNQKPSKQTDRRKNRCTQT